MLTRTLLCATLSAVALPSLADTVWLKNGDRLTGKISVLDGGKLLIETEYGGSIPLKWNQIATLESDQKLLIKQDDVTGEVAQSLQAAEQAGHSGQRCRAAPWSWRASHRSSIPSR